MRILRSIKPHEVSKFPSAVFNWVHIECVSMGAAGAQIRRSLGHHLLHPQILRLLVLLKPTAQIGLRALFYRTDYPRRSKSQTYALRTVCIYSSFKQKLWKTLF